MAAVSNELDNTGYEILPDTGYQILPDIAFYRIQDPTGYLIPGGYRIIPISGTSLEETRQTLDRIEDDIIPKSCLKQRFLFVT